MVMADTELNGGRHLSLAPPPTPSDLEGEPGVPAAAPKKRGRKPGTKNGEGKKPQAQAESVKPGKKGATKKKETLVRVRSAELKARGENGDADAAKLLKAIQRAHGKWTGALAKKATVSTECGQRVKSAEAAFSNAIEASLPVGVVEVEAYREKLTACEVRWQQWGEAKAENIEEKKGARDDVKAALEGLNEAIEESRQARLPGIG